ncbi:MAG: phosphotransferase [Thermoleophilia bacterium]|nr:phosphotransferase [Thermoleophilia bacterium]
MRADDLELLGAGREAEVFAWGDGRVLRLARDPDDAPMVDREAAALRAAHRAGAPVPRAHERLTVDGRPGLVLDRVDGTDLLDRLERRPWTLRGVAATLGAEHAAVHRIAAPAELPPLREELRARLGSPLVPAEVRETALQRLGRLPGGDRLLHGDFHPANLLRTAAGCVVIDWTNGTRGDPEADVARTLLLTGGGALPDDTSTLVRALAPFLRRLLVGGYLRAYERAAPLDRARVERWLPVWAAARLAEDIPQERERLLAISSRASA